MRRAVCLAVAAVGFGCDARTVDAVRRAPAGDAGLPACAVPFEDRGQQTLLAAGDRSHWLQPWRAYQDTWPARRMRQAAGITSTWIDEAPLAAALRAGGFARGYFTMSWADLTYDDPTQFEPRRLGELRARLMVLRDAGLRPLVMIQGHHGLPCPRKAVKVRVVAAAAAGSRTLKIDPADVGSLRAGRSGFDHDGKGAGILFSEIASDGTVTLSKPLPAARTAGAHDVTVLRFAPFELPTRADGTPNSTFRETLDGWEQFVSAVLSEAAGVLGDRGFDLEIWNELVGGSDFLDANSYYERPIEERSGDRFAVVARAVLERSLAVVRARGLAAVRVGSGFANTRWTDSGATLPPGIDALDRHISVSGLSFPEDAAAETTRGLRSDGRPNGAFDAMGRWAELFTPRYRAVFPEQALLAVSSRSNVWPDLSPIVSQDANGIAHGRSVQPAGAERPPSLWITAFSLNPRDGLVPIDTNAPADLTRFKAKVALRALASYVGKGAEALVFYSRLDPMITLPDGPMGGPVIDAVSRFLAEFAGPETHTPVMRPLRVTSVGRCGDGDVEVAGDGTAEFPSLVLRDLVALFPFQADERRFVVPAYVMTRDLGRVRRADAPATDPARFDLPPTEFSVVVEGAAPGARATLVDPLTGERLPVSPRALGQGRTELTLPLTDWPRLLVIED